MNATDIDPTTDEELLRIRSQFMPSAYLLHHPIVAEAASGAWLTDASGRQYIDFAGGIAVVNVGHRDAQVVEAVREQLIRLIHSGPVTANRPSKATISTVETVAEMLVIPYISPGFAIPTVSS